MRTISTLISRANDNKVIDFNNKVGSNKSKNKSTKSKNKKLKTENLAKSNSVKKSEFFTPKLEKLLSI